jgi:hypothetical protein
MHGGSFLVVMQVVRFPGLFDDTAAVVTAGMKVRGDRVDEVYTAHCRREHGGSR